MVVLEALEAPEVLVVPGFLPAAEHLHPCLGECPMLHYHQPELVVQSEELVEPAAAAAIDHPVHRPWKHPQVVVVEDHTK